MTGTGANERHAISGATDDNLTTALINQGETT
jgi:hypothetical protein